MVRTVIETSKKKTKPRKAKIDLQNKRLWAEGARQQILEKYIHDYAAALDRGTNDERLLLLRRILREYFGRVHWSTPDHVEPVLQAWDPEAAQPLEDLTDTQKMLKDARVKELSERIRRWYRYRVQRRNRFRRSWARDPAKDPLARFLLKLSGMAKPKKRCQPYQQFQKERGEALGPIIDKRWAEAQLTDASLAGKFPDAGFRTKVVQALFNGLPEEHRATYAARAKAEGEQQAADFKEMMTRPPDASPKLGTGTALMRLVSWIAPILQEIFNVTGCHATLLVGGPQPEFGGDISVQHFSFGRNLSPTGDHWGQWDKPRFKKQVLEFFVQYLQTAYTAEDCARSAFATTESNFDPADLPPRAVGTAFGVHWPTTDTVIPDLKSDADESASDMDIDAGVDSDDPFTVANQKTAKAKKPKKPKKKAVLSTITQMVDDAYPSNVFSAPASAAPAPLPDSTPFPFAVPSGASQPNANTSSLPFPGDVTLFGQQSPAQASGFGVGTTLSSSPAHVMPNVSIDQLRGLISFDDSRGWTDGEGIERTMTWNAGNSRARQAPDGSNSPNSPLRIAPESAFMPSISRSRRLPAPPPATNNVYFAGLLDFTQASASSRIPSPTPIFATPSPIRHNPMPIVVSPSSTRGGAAAGASQLGAPSTSSVRSDVSLQPIHAGLHGRAPTPASTSLSDLVPGSRPPAAAFNAAAGHPAVSPAALLNTTLIGGVANNPARTVPPLMAAKSTTPVPIPPLDAPVRAARSSPLDVGATVPPGVRSELGDTTSGASNATTTTTAPANTAGDHGVRNGRRSHRLAGEDIVLAADARVPCPADAPKWFIKMHSRVGTVDLGHTFNAVVNSWVRVEVASRFKTGKGMNARYR
ncbi:hypothetical protein MKEN_00296900 [Mycena kentingensis (nom. inval.)]|nr:hypothetical protein MKEN_00296900 [Mycena kentingensis (nom. inval.)]